MNDFVSQFLLEARELTEQATADLLALEQAPSDATKLDGAFRAFHTLKGGAAIMEYAPMERMLHQAEDVLQGLRRGSAGVAPDVIDGCLACIGQVIRWLDAIERTGELPADAEQVGVRIARQLDAPVEPVGEPRHDWVGEVVAWAGKRSAEGASAARLAIRYAPAVDAFFKGTDPVALVAAVPGITAVRAHPRDSWPALEEMQPFDCNLIVEALSSAARPDVERALGAIIGEVQLVEVGEATASSPASNPSAPLARLLIQTQVDFARAPRSPDAFAGAIGSAGRVVANVLRSLGRHADVSAIETSSARCAAQGVAQAFLDAVADVLNSLRQENPASLGEAPAEARREAGAIRVDVEKVDAIVDLTGELLVVKHALAHLAQVATEGGDPATLAARLRTETSRLDRHVGELQRAVLDLRVLPLGRVFSRFPLLIRETATKLGKQVAFRTEGDDTVADKAVVEALFEPLLHAVRNAIDHGIETPTQRTRAGKPATADILMRAFREGEHVIVEVSDDGRGVDTSIVRKLAISRGVAMAEIVDALDEAEALDLIFASGFTTAAAVTELSGRGVGMNAVRSAVERIGGDVSLINMPGQGLLVRFTLPFTVMMTRVMTVEASGQVFGLPFDAVLETVRVSRAQIKPLGGGRALVLRGITVPVIDLAASLQLEGRQAAGGGVACLVIASIGGQRVAIEIERPGERLDLMLKPVEGWLAGMRAISGTSLLGDGRVLIILDLGALLE